MTRSQTKRKANFALTQWSLEPLEPRLMLAGDAGAEVAAAAASSSTVGDAMEGTETTAGPRSDQTAEAFAEIAFIDSAVEETEQLTQWMRSGVEIVLLDQGSSAIDQMTSVLKSRANVKTVHVVSHAESGALQLSGQRIDAETLQQHSAKLDQWRHAFADNADILLYGCNAASQVAGQNLITTLARLTSADVAASDDATGHATLGGDWDLEFQTGNIESALLASVDRLQHVEMVLPVTVRAAGTTGEEQMQLQINGEVVQTWNNIGGNADTRQFQTFTYNGDVDLTTDEVRIAFTNDLYQPEQGIDRNLVVDSITANGLTIESENANTFGTGTWKEEDGITAGYRRSEWIHSDGYFHTPPHRTPVRFPSLPQEPRTPKRSNFGSPANVLRRGMTLVVTPAQATSFSWIFKPTPRSTSHKFKFGSQTICMKTTVPSTATCESTASNWMERHTKPRPRMFTPPAPGNHPD
jgi:hypothetical protein